MIAAAQGTLAQADDVRKPALEPVLERIARTGEMRAGARTNAAPFSSFNAAGEAVGFSLDLVREMHAALEARLGRTVTLTFHPVTAEDRMDKIESGEIDINCGITTPTWAREQRVDFSIPIFQNGTRLVVRRSMATGLADLTGRKIAAIDGSTTIGILQRTVPNAEIVEVPDMDTAMQRFAEGSVDGVSNIAVVLRALIERLDFKGEVVMLPPSTVLSVESMACILPSNDSAWRDFVNHQLAAMLDGVADYRGRYVEIYQHWFGPGSELFYPLDRDAGARLSHARMWLN